LYIPPPVLAASLKMSVQFVRIKLLKYELHIPAPWFALFPSKRQPATVGLLPRLRIPPPFALLIFSMNSQFVKMGIEE
jgi:hypothetical protein